MMSESLRASGHLRLEDVCARFEAAWKTAGADAPAPRIDDYLDDGPGAERAARLRELLLLDMHYRRGRGESPAAGDYLERFPDCGDVLPTLPAPGFDGPPGASTAPDGRESAPGGEPCQGADPRGGERPPQVPGYEIGRPLGRGGMGVVWLGRDRRLGRDVAVKVMHDEMAGDPHLVRRFLEEARVASQLPHPAIPPVHELGELPDGRPYFAMKVVRGRTLAELLDARSGPADDLPRFLAVFEQVCQAVAYAHSKGVIHRDLKPANVMVGAFAEVQVMDWGLAKVLGEEPVQGAAAGVVEAVRTADAASATRVGAVMGTYAYMPPEQARGEVDRLDRRSDVFGLGAILCEILTGFPPYVGTNEQRRTQAQLGQLTGALERLWSCGADGKLIEIAHSCLHAPPEARPAGAGLVAQAVASYRARVEERLRAAELDRAAAAARAEEGKATAAAQAREQEAKATAAAERRARRLALGLVAALGVAIVATGYFLFLTAHERDDAKAARQDAEGQKQVAQNEKGRADEERRKAETHAGNEKAAREDAEAQKQVAQEEKGHAETARNLADIYRRRAEWLAYSGQIARARRAAADGETVEAQDLLDACQRDIRGWEHRFLSTLINRAQRTFPGPGGVSTVRLSPDGRRLAGAGADGTVKVWDVATGREVCTLGGHTGPVTCVCFSADGRFLADAGEDMTVKVWDVATGKEPLTLQGHTTRVTGLAFSNDGKQVASASAGGDPVRGGKAGEVKLWDAATGQEIHPLIGHHNGVSIVCFSPDGQRLASSGLDGIVKVWDTGTGKLELRLKGYPSGVSGLCFSPDSKLLAGASTNWFVQVWDVATGEQKFFREGHTSGLTILGFSSACFSPDGKQLASASGKTVKVWDVDTGQQVRTHTWQTSISTMWFGPEGLRLGGASRDTLKVWDPQAGQEARTFTGHANVMRSVSFSPDGKRLAAASSDGSVKVWDAATGKDELTLKGHDVCFSPDGSRIATANAGQLAKVWDAATGQEVLTLKGHTTVVSCVCFSPDGRRLVSAGGAFQQPDGEVKVWDAATGEELPVKLKGARGLWSSVCFSPDGERIASATQGGTVKVWDAATGEEKLSLAGYTPTTQEVQTNSRSHQA
jgi:WD40 repeat protein/tRNA A-37 threonylcarbamoyl transferase component Bud32